MVARYAGGTSSPQKTLLPIRTARSTQPKHDEDLSAWKDCFLTSMCGNQVGRGESSAGPRNQQKVAADEYGRMGEAVELPRPRRIGLKAIKRKH
jgi:hypothetical protein